VSALARLNHRSSTVELDERESHPVLVPAVDQDGRSRIGGQVADAPQSVRVGGSLRFLVER
jgi:hypothetical protein